MKVSRRLALVPAATLAALLTLSACGGGVEGDGAPGDLAAPAFPAEQRPAGAGGLLAEGVWRFREVTFDGQEENLPSEARAWIALHGDGTASGDYGCTPFRLKAEVSATRLTLGEKLTPRPAPSATPAPPLAGSGPCAPHSGYDRLKLTRFEKQVQGALRGNLSLSLERPNTQGEVELHLKNQQGDDITLVQARSDTFFTTRWKLSTVTAYDSQGPEFAAGDRMYFDFHKNGEVSGKLGCNDFTARATFSGLHVFFHDVALPSHRGCDEKIMEEEAGVLATLRKSFNYTYWAEPGSSRMSLTHDLAFPAMETGFLFQGLPRR
ncbi:META domain-containing protein [Streptomyces sp. NPDC045369]|uniref:META domain-containing protein n=1 Tax=Streptomyces sp. NPDC045369 TaxID=3155732 RepID=UPI0033D0C85D